MNVRSRSCSSAENGMSCPPMCSVAIASARGPPDVSAGTSVEARGGAGRGAGWLAGLGGGRVLVAAGEEHQHGHDPAVDVGVAAQPELGEDHAGVLLDAVLGHA